MVRAGMLVVSVVAAAVLGATTAEAEIRIGVAGPMTGDQSWFGEQFERGARMAAADLNGQGGVLGQEVELIVADDFCDPDQAVAAANNLSVTASSSSSGIGARTPRSRHRPCTRRHRFL